MVPIVPRFVIVMDPPAPDIVPPLAVIVPDTPP